MKSKILKTATILRASLTLEISIKVVLGYLGFEGVEWIPVNK